MLGFFEPSWHLCALYRPYWLLLELDQKPSVLTKLRPGTFGSPSVNSASLDFNLVKIKPRKSKSKS